MLIGDTYLYFENSTNSTVSVTVRTYPRVGWINVGFSTSFMSSDIVGSIFSFLPNYINSNNFTSGNTIQDNLDYEVDQQFQIAFTVPYSYLTKYSYIILSRNVVTTPSTPQNISQSNFVLSRQITMQNNTTPVDFCQDQSIGLSTRFLANYSFLFYPSLFLHFLLFSLLVYYREVPVIKIRSFSPMIPPLLFGIDLVSDYLLNNISYEENAKINCIVTAFVLYPSISASYFLDFI